MRYLLTLISIKDSKFVGFSKRKTLARSKGIHKL
nr:MAG TPA: hypothetical protein [Caudoviricetes sp.]